MTSTNLSVNRYRLWGRNESNNWPQNENYVLFKHFQNFSCFV